MTDVTVECEMPYIPYYIRGNLKEEEKYLKNWVKDFQDFIRDHRSQDPVNLSVVPIYKDVCSKCEREYESYDENGKTFCANCGEELEREEAIRTHLTKREE